MTVCWRINWSLFGYQWPRRTLCRYNISIEWNLEPASGKVCTPYMRVDHINDYAIQYHVVRSNRAFIETTNIRKVFSSSVFFLSSLHWKIACNINVLSQGKLPSFDECVAQTNTLFTYPKCPSTSFYLISVHYIALLCSTFEQTDIPFRCPWPLFLTWIVFNPNMGYVNTCPASKVWDEIIFPFPNAKAALLKVGDG